MDSVYLLLSGTVFLLGGFHLHRRDSTLRIVNNKETESLNIEYLNRIPIFQFYAKTVSDCELVAIKKNNLKNLS